MYSEMIKIIKVVLRYTSGFISYFYYSCEAKSGSTTTSLSWQLGQFSNLILNSEYNPETKVVIYDT